MIHLTLIFKKNAGKFISNIKTTHTQFTTSLYSIIGHSNNASMCGQKNIGIIEYDFGDKAIEFGAF